jgi:hypothetical protein
VRQCAQETGCAEVQSLLKHCAWRSEVDRARLPTEAAAWITEAYPGLTHEIAMLGREAPAARSVENGAPALTRTVAGATLGDILGVLYHLDEQSTEHGLPSGGTWSSRVTRLRDAWHRSLHAERYRLDFRGPPPLVERVFGLVQRKLSP